MPISKPANINFVAFWWHHRNRFALWCIITLSMWKIIMSSTHNSVERQIKNSPITLTDLPNIIFIILAKFTHYTVSVCNEYHFWGSCSSGLLLSKTVATKILVIHMITSSRCKWLLPDWYKWQKWPSDKFFWWFPGSPGSLSALWRHFGFPECH